MSFQNCNDISHGSVSDPPKNEAIFERFPLLGNRASIVSTTTPNSGRSDAVIKRFWLQTISREINPELRVAKCQRIPHGGVVSILHHPRFMRASYGGLQICGSVHVCPVCATKIAERRKEELTAALAHWAGDVLMATFTLQHSADDRLADIAGALNGAYRLLRNGKMWQLFVSRSGLVGSITAREYTYGAAGWHPHLHALFFVNNLSASELSTLRSWLRERWSAAVCKYGRYAGYSVGCDVRRANDAGELVDYALKSASSWTAQAEMTKSNQKQGRKGGRSPQQLLDDAGRGDDQAAGLFREYSLYTYRKNALVWTPGLRALLLPDEEEELTDEQVATRQDEDARLLIVLTGAQWCVILGNDVRAELLLEAAAGDVDRVRAFVAQFGIELPSW